MLPTARPVVWVVVLAVGYPLGIGASSAQAQVLGFVSPAPVYSCPTLLHPGPGLTPTRPAPGPTSPAVLTPTRPRPLRPKTTLSPTAPIPITIKTVSSTTPAIRTGVLISGEPGLRVGDESPG